MKNLKVCFVDDAVSTVGGTSLTLNAIVEPNENNVDFISTLDFSLKNVFEDYDLYVLGNALGFSKNSLDAILLLLDLKPFCKIEFDYGYCINRGRIPHKILSGEDCNCPREDVFLKELYEKIRSKALHIFYMSKDQMKIHNEFLPKICQTKTSILSSCFTKQNLSDFKKLKSKKKNEKYAIIDGQGGWHSEAKGVKKSIKYAENNNLKFDLIKTETHDEMINLLSSYKGLISFPIIEDTCPRITLEARYMGLEVITNEMSQHIKEEWWKKNDEEAFNFTASRPKYFWDKIKCLKY
ncbi:MAG: hypothetical protein P8M67_04655 [Opitutales bacterium]|nr:hypothetical protein [Opitutales bacterium]